MKNYTVTANGLSDVKYEDAYCKAEVGVADFRDPCWYIGTGIVIDKRTNQQCKLSLNQKKILYIRVANELHQEKLYDDKLKFINCGEYALEEYDGINILEII